MQYILSEKKDLDIGKDFIYTTKEKALKWLKSAKNNYIQFDTETTSLDCHTGKIVLMQFGDGKHQLIVDCTTINPLVFKNILETSNLILQNAKFDLGFLYKLGIVPRGKIWDTMLAEQVLGSNYYKKIKSSLYDVVKKYCNVELDKSQRSKLFENGIISYRDLVYSAKDVVYLHKIKERQEVDARFKGVTRAIALENEAVKALTYIEFSGMKIDIEKWLAKKDKLLPLIFEREEELFEELAKIDYVKDNIGLQYDMFKGLTIDINVNSETQMKPIFKSLGFDLSDPTAKSGESIASSILSRYEEAHPLVKLYLSYKKMLKDFTTYGEKFLNNININTNRLHTNFKQIISTGRVSSSKPNLNNIPRDKYTRACFVPENDNVIIDIDYGNQEGRLLCNYAKEQNMIDFFNSGTGDAHAYVAKLCFPEELEGIEVDEVKDKRPDLRQLAKAAGFAINIFGKLKNNYYICA